MMKKITMFSLLLVLSGVILIHSEAEATKPVETTVANDVTGGFQIDQTITTEKVIPFRSFKNQGTLYLKAKDLKNVSLFINDTAVEPARHKKNKWLKLDIAPFTKNGDNQLKITRQNTEKAVSLEIKLPYPELIDNTNKKEHQTNDSFQLMDELVTAEIAHGFTSAQVVVTKDGQILKSSAYGQLNAYTQNGSRINNGVKATSDTLYDLASNTKMYATNYAIQLLVTQGKLSIYQKVSDIFPAFIDQPADTIKGKSTLTIKDILMHQAGFPADPEYHNNNYDPHAPDEKGVNSNKLYTQDREEVMGKIIQTPLEYTPGTQTKYSDVDYMLLGFIIEKITGKRLDVFTSETFYQPLGLAHVTFNPLQNGFKKGQTAATELNGNTRDGARNFNNIRKATIQGAVQDEKAYYSMKGVSGHAGLFSNAEDLAVLTQIMINRGGYENHKFFSKEVIDEFTKPTDNDPSFGLGWRRNGPNLYSWAFSPSADESAIGHTGWVGTLTVIDPVQNISVVLLTNKKNTRVLDKVKDPNDFIGDHYLTAGYGAISTLAFNGANGATAETNNTTLLELIQDKYHTIQATGSTAPDKASLQALLDVAKKRESTSKPIQEFFQSENGKTIMGFAAK